MSWGILRDVVHVGSRFLWMRNDAAGECCFSMEVPLLVVFQSEVCEQSRYSGAVLSEV